MFPFSTVSRIKKQDIDHLSKPYHIYIYIYIEMQMFSRTVKKLPGRPSSFSINLPNLEKLLSGQPFYSLHHIYFRQQRKFGY
jgi:hypothetical protein